MSVLCVILGRKIKEKDVVHIGIIKYTKTVMCGFAFSFTYFCYLCQMFLIFLLCQIVFHAYPIDLHLSIVKLIKSYQSSVINNNIKKISQSSNQGIFSVCHSHNQLRTIWKGFQFLEQLFPWNDVQARKIIWTPKAVIILFKQTFLNQCIVYYHYVSTKSPENTLDMFDGWLFCGSAGHSERMMFCDS